MKQLKTIVIAGPALLLLAFGVAMAGNMDSPTGAGGHSMGRDLSMDHSSKGQKMRKMDHSNHGKNMSDMDHSNHKGKNIRNVTLDGFMLAYHLIDLQEKIKAMKAAGHDNEMNMTHHLMLYVKNAAGAPVTTARVGFLVVSPDGSHQKLMTMGMGGGFGTDIDLGQLGIYTVKSKLIAGDEIIRDGFIYTVD